MQLSELYSYYDEIIFETLPLTILCYPTKFGVKKYPIQETLHCTMEAFLIYITVNSTTNICWTSCWWRWTSRRWQLWCSRWLGQFSEKSISLYARFCAARPILCTSVYFGNQVFNVQERAELGPFGALLFLSFFSSQTCHLASNRNIKVQLLR